MGIIGAISRINDALASLSLEDINALKERGIRTIWVVAIENYIRLDNGTSTDFAILMIHNATTGETVWVTSRGAVFPEAWVKYTRSLGFEAEECLKGKFTVRGNMGKHTPGMDGKNPHIYLTGLCRFNDLLGEAFDSVTIC